MPRTMTLDEVRSFLSNGTRTAKVATSGPGGEPHVVPVWFVLDGEELVFTTGGDSVKGRNLRRDPRAAVVVDEEVAPYAFVHIRGHATMSEDLEELLRFATAISSRYMGADRAEEFGRRNAVPGELLVRLRPKRVIAAADLAGSSGRARGSRSPARPGCASPELIALPGMRLVRSAPTALITSAGRVYTESTTRAVLPKMHVPVDVR